MSVKKPKILLVYTGGTIGMIKDFETGVLRAFDFKNLADNIPELKLLDCDIETIVFEKLQNLPILYLSNYIIQNKTDYYRLLQELRDNENWEEWLLFMIHGIEKTSRETEVIIGIIMIASTTPATNGERV